MIVKGNESETHSKFNSCISAHRYLTAILQLNDDRIFYYGFVNLNQTHYTNILNTLRHFYSTVWGIAVIINYFMMSYLT